MGQLSLFKTRLPIQNILVSARNSPLSCSLFIYETIQEFIELIRAGQRMAAIEHSKDHLHIWATVHAEEFHRAMGSLIFNNAAENNPYAELFDSNQWDKMANLFYQELFKLHSMTQQSLLSLELQVSLITKQKPDNWIQSAFEASCCRGLRLFTRPCQILGFQ